MQESSKRDQKVVNMVAQASNKWHSFKVGDAADAIMTSA
jgi:hypothetical protein